WFRLELRLLADVALIGFPNAGKSTLLASATPAMPKIADYPFTTIEPQLGVVEVDYQRLVLVDIPGLLEGAAQGVGLGDEFLRHIQRTKVLIHMVSGESEDPLKDVRAVDAELTAFDPRLAGRPQVVAVNKIDLPTVRERTAELRVALAPLKRPVFFISAQTGEGVSQLMRAAFAALDRAVDPSLPEPQREDYKVFRPLGEGAERVVRREDGAYELTGSGVPALVVPRDVAKGELALIMRERLRRTNWRRALERAGVRAGDRVLVGEVQVDW
ncbi:MAG: GTPase, partial [Chloroflexota bacterium]